MNRIFLLLALAFPAHLWADLESLLLELNRKPAEERHKGLVEGARQEAAPQAPDAETRRLLGGEDDEIDRPFRTESGGGE